MSQPQAKFTWLGHATLRVDLPTGETLVIDRALVRARTRAVHASWIAARGKGAQRPRTDLAMVK